MQQAINKRQRDRLQAQSWATYVLSCNSPPCAILDTETTGFSRSAEVCDIALVDCLTGDILLDTLVKPTHSIPEKLTEIHGITDSMVATAPRFDEVWLPFLLALGERQLIIYNAAYDLRLLKQSAAPYDIQWHLNGYTWLNGSRIHCAMLQHSAWVGEIGSRGDYRWQKLQGGNHRALGDCFATLDTIKRMSNG